MSEAVNIELEEYDGGGRYVARLDGAEAEMTFRRLADDTIAIDHTLVPPAFRGRGIAEQLVRRGIEDARQRGERIVPLCSYVAAQFRRYSEWADLLAN